MDSTAHTRESSEEDYWHEELHQRIEFMKESYLTELNEMYQKLVTKLEQPDSLPQQPTPDQVEKLKVFKVMLERLISFLQVSESDISPSFKEKLASYEKQIINFIDTSRPMETMPPLQSGQLPPPLVDWKEEVYQKVKSMKERYLAELSEMYQELVTKLGQHGSLAQQPKSDQIEKLKAFTRTMERTIAFLQVSKSNISPNLKETMGLIEKQIIYFINMCRAITIQVPPPHMHSMSKSQPQVTQVESHENQVNFHSKQQNNMASMEHNSLSGVSTAQQSKMNSMQPSTNLDSGPAKAVNSPATGSSELTSTKP